MRTVATRYSGTYLLYMRMGDVVTFWPGMASSNINQSWTCLLDITYIHARTVCCCMTFEWVLCGTSYFIKIGILFRKPN